MSSVEKKGMCCLATHSPEIDMPHKVFSFQPNHLFMGMGDLCRILPHKIPGKVQLNMPFRFI
jgi:hypothetical protein